MSEDDRPAALILKFCEREGMFIRERRALRIILGWQGDNPIVQHAHKMMVLHSGQWEKP